MYDCVVAAAGASSRMGSPKPLLPWRGSTMVEAVVGAALGAGCRVLLVVGCRGTEVAAPFLRRTARAGSEPGPGGPAGAAAPGAVEIVDNPAWELGMTGSIQAALGRVGGEAFFVAHADMPLLPSSVFAALAAERETRLRSGATEAALFASRGGAKGHPALIPSAWIPDILGLGPGVKLRDFIERRPYALVDVGEDYALIDVDTPEDYARALELDASPARTSAGICPLPRGGADPELDGDPRSR
jgi:molybdenum cofactor cytidylyltransferase